MKTAMESLKEMVDVNTVVGDPVETPDGSVIVPISRVSCGFVAGGGEYDTNKENEQSLPFGGGSGAGVSVQPVGFLVVGKDQVRLLPVDGNAIIDRLIDVTPQLLNQVHSFFDKNTTEKNSAKEEPNLTWEI